MASDNDTFNTCHLFSLPNEVLAQILSSFSTRSLLPWTAVSHRFHALILRILHYRLRIAASLPEYKLILKCFPPSNKYYESYVFCTYIGTDDLSSQFDGKGSLYENVDPAERLGRLSSVYSRFRPERIPENATPPATRWDSFGTDEELEPDQDERTVTRLISFENFEDFYQLCAVVKVVKVRLGSNLLLSNQTVEDRVVRVFRDWLQERERWTRAQDHGDDSPDDTSDRKERDNASILWIDPARKVGIKVRVRGRHYLNQQMPLFVLHDEEPSVTYELDIEELHIRTTSLLMTLEKSQEEQENHPKAMIFPRSV
ncbi:F-box protein [Aspergillus saccharolyticus JOP 1030-1]|uniref:F-box domain protein n=1 Tax=Aspergillus saccharolyticus JOP 1030-1 TaxID=1450539 RepID=A0A318ZKI1_9EURO|nr:F-box domain protein [Aspergillus saccharolyticus JOP 1030-1]PYH44290.1 F-box domain protein [Aspergillus saccharolyticus JOP 1030-1]